MNRREIIEDCIMDLEMVMETLTEIKDVDRYCISDIKAAKRKLEGMIK